MRILITGCNGMLGHDMTEEFRDFNITPLPKKDLDITKKSVVIKKFQKIKPEIVINCAAYTDVDGSESNKKLSFDVNARALKNISKACNKVDASLVHFSTDYVFDGRNRQGYREDSRKHPVSYYGLTKSLGEDYIAQSMNKYYIVRTSWLFGEYGKNFVGAIIKKSGEKEIKVVNDQKGSPTYTKDLAHAIKILMQKYPYGTYHITSKGNCTWYDFAREILRQTNSKTKVIPMTSADIGRPAKRPKCSILINTKFKNNMPNWKNALKRYVGSLK